MKIDLVHVPRRLNWPLWAVLLILTWLSFGSATIWLGRYFDRPVHLCLLKRFTGFACPTCGFTRGLLSLIHGDITQAWLYNPFLFSGLTLFFAAAAARIIFGRCVKIRLTGAERRIAWTLFFALLLVNWVYVIVYVG